MSGPEVGVLLQTDESKIHMMAILYDKMEKLQVDKGAVVCSNPCPSRSLPPTPFPELVPSHHLRALVPSPTYGLTLSATTQPRARPTSYKPPATLAARPVCGAPEGGCAR